ncbi:MAG: DUF4168 domain-containing protein [Gemmatimonadota bacterium]
MFTTRATTTGSRRLLGAAAAALAGAVLLSAPGTAQEQQQAPPQQETEVSDDELETFAEVHIDVQDIREEMNRTVQESEDPEEAQAAQQEANQEMVSVIEDHDMTPERYTQISQAINQDPELQEELQKLVEEIEEEREGGVSG